MSRCFAILFALGLASFAALPGDASTCNCTAADRAECTAICTEYPGCYPISYCPPGEPCSCFCQCN